MAKECAIKPKFTAPSTLIAAQVTLTDGIIEKSGMNSVQWIYETCSWLKMSASDTPTNEILAAIEFATPEDLEQLLEILTAELGEAAPHTQRMRVVCQLVASRLKVLVESETRTAEVALISPHVLENCYESLSDADATASAHILQMLATQGDEESIDALASAIGRSPPEDWQAVGLALSPLWAATSEQLEFFFERLGDEFVHPTTMAVLLDLANFSVRSKRVTRHPWIDRSSDLNSLLGSMIQRLETIEKDPAQFGEDVNSIQQVLQDSVALQISLCDALGLIGEPSAAANLMHSMQLSHRRIQTEAAGALARLGDDAGKQRLIELASDNVARIRAVSYAEELGFADEIDEQLRFPQALAESELASWLAEPAQYGVPPSRVEFMDSRLQYWPSYEEPRDCFLFRYWYDFPAGEVCNVGLAGPVAHAFQSNLTSLPVDDIYAAFAGWHAEHEDIFEIPIALCNVVQRREADQLSQRLEESGLDVTELVSLTFFLGEVALLAKVKQGDKPLIVVTDEQELVMFPQTPDADTLTPDVVLCIYRGRKLLRTFNA